MSTKFWRCYTTRQKRISVLASSLEDLLNKAGDKQQLQGVSLIVVLEKDVTEMEETPSLTYSKLSIDASRRPTIMRIRCSKRHCCNVWADTKMPTCQRLRHTTESTTVTTAYRNCNTILLFGCIIINATFKLT
ncbi:uncharacterized protein LOC132750618 [Ruditapes philippinarum]|uniref:uncharacterized protein LOC132750618 n=1 Tax=Ruditapes philippinarum TaxID=129788 RepID=UPI00295AB9A2|nr:uncharacterized protein LOC132750618 [Ruditapes philippinarum]